MFTLINLYNLIALCAFLGVAICILLYQLWSMQRLIDYYRKELITVKSTLTTIHQFQSHHVRGPLTNILAITDLLTAEPNTLTNEETKSLFTDLRTSTRELDRIIGEIVLQTQTYHR